MPMDEQLLGRTMPHSPEAEQAVLGSMLIDTNCIKDVMEKLQAEDFYLQQNRDIFETIYSMFIFSKPVDGVTVAGEMEKAGTANENTRSYLLQLMEVTPTSANVMEYVRLVREKSLMRSVASAAADITAEVQKGVGSAQGMLELAEQKIYDIRRGRSGQGMTPIGVVLQDVMSHLAEVSERGGGELPGLPTGFSGLDDLINGLGNSHLVILAARPGVGKTTMALNIALHVAKNNDKTVAIFSLEMPKEELAMRLIASEGLVENERLTRGNLRESDWERIGQAASVISQTDIRVDDNAMLTVAEMNAKCRRLDNLGLVVIDYLQLMNGADNQDNKGENRQNEVSKMSRMLKIMAKDLNVPVLCLSQLSRANEKRTGDKRPMLSDLRDSGAIEQDADVVMFLYQDKDEAQENGRSDMVECNVEKNRHGGTGRVLLKWMPQFYTFNSVEERYEEPEE